MLFHAAKEAAMLRITVHDTSDVLELKLEGRLAGPWVAILHDCWQEQTSQARGRTLHVDLRAVTFVDAAGRALLAEMTGRHAQLFGGDCQMKALLAEIARETSEAT
jgi:ABC-type transporter Mla MlaB component